MSTIKTTKTTKVETKAADKVETKKVEETAPKAEVKKEAAPKAAAKKEAAPKATAKKEAAPKAAAKKTAATAKKAPAKKAAVKKTEEVFIEYAGAQVSTADIIAKVVEATGKKASSIKTLNVYVQPEFGIAYYTADGTEGKINY